jgi:hypothetical protein
MFQDLPDGLRSIADVPDGFRPSRPMCSRVELLAIIRSIAPETDVSDPAWAVLDAAGFSIEFNIGDSDPVESVMLHVRGNEGALGVIRELASALGRPAIDCSAGEILDFDSPEAAAGIRKWRAYRDQVLDHR